MIEAVFTESAGGSLQVAKSHWKNQIIGGCFGVIITKDDGTEATPEEIRQAEETYAKRERQAWENAIPIEIGDIFCFPLGLSFGDLHNRISAIKVMYSFWDAQLEAETERMLSRVNSDLGEIRDRLRKGESLRIWYSDHPDEMCGFYWLLSNISEGNIVGVKLPKLEEKDDVILSYNGWGELSPHEWGRFKNYEHSISSNMHRYYRHQWLTMEKENAPLRAVLNGTLTSVSEDIYDRYILKELINQPQEFNEARLIGTILGKYPLGFGDGFLHYRIEKMVASGMLVALTQPPEGECAYRRMLRKKDDFHA